MCVSASESWRLVRQKDGNEGQQRAKHVKQTLGKVVCWCVLMCVFLTYVQQQWLAASGYSAPIRAGLFIESALCQTRWRAVSCDHRRFINFWGDSTGDSAAPGDKCSRLSSQRWNPTNHCWGQRSQMILFSSWFLLSFRKHFYTFIAQHSMFTPLFSSCM